MAAPADKQLRRNDIDSGTDSLNSQLLAQVNNLTAALRIVCAKLDLDAGVTDTNYFALSCDSAIATAPIKIVAIG
jgi:hypothetical protein